MVTHMCDNCFTSLIYQFKSPKEFGVLQTIVQEKTQRGKLLTVNKDPEHFFAPFLPYTMYKCSNCSETWMLSMPESHKSGFFLNRKSAVRYKKELDERSKLRAVGVLILVLVIFIISIIMMFS